MIESTFRKLLRSGFKYRLAIFGFSVTILMVFIALFAPFLAPHDPYTQDISKRFLPPVWEEKGTIEHLLGTDHVGRDVLSRLIYGARISLSVGLFSVAIAATFGIIFGLLAGYYMGMVDLVIGYFVDLMLSVPFVLLALALVATLGAGFLNVFIVLGVTSWPLYARVIRTEVLRIKSMEYVTAARALGMKDTRIILFEILPNLANTVIVIATIQTAVMIIEEAFLSFLGLGVQPPIPSWGVMLSEGRAHMLRMWWLATFPGIAISITAAGINLFGDGLRDFLDPMKRKRV